MSFAWDADNNVDKLRKADADRLSASATAAMLGISRSSALCKARRLGLSFDSPTKTGADRLRPQSGSQINVRVSAPRPERLPVKIVLSEPKKPQKLPGLHAFDPGDHPTVSILDLRTGMCRWPYGETEIRYCGDPTTDPLDPDCPYCEAHAQLAYTSAKDRSPKQAAHDAKLGYRPRFAA